MAQMLVTYHDGDVPTDMAALTALPGVGRKTANVVLGARARHTRAACRSPMCYACQTESVLASGDDPVEVEAQLCAALSKSTWNARLRRTDPARATRLPSETSVRRVLNTQGLQPLSPRHRQRSDHHEDT